MFPGLGRWGCHCFQQSQLLAGAPPCPHLSLQAPFQRCVVTSWGPGVHGASWVHVRGLSRSPQGPRATPHLPCSLDKGCSRLCFSGVTEPDASNPPAGPDLQWLWGLPGPDAKTPGLRGSCEWGWGWHLQPLPSPLRVKGKWSHQLRDHSSFLARPQDSVNEETQASVSQVTITQFPGLHLQATELPG